MRCAYPSVVLPCCLRYDNTEQDDGKGTRTCLKRAAAHAEQLVEQRLDRSVLRNHGDDLSSSNQRKHHATPPEQRPKDRRHRRPPGQDAASVRWQDIALPNPIGSDIAPLLPARCSPALLTPTPLLALAPPRRARCRRFAAAAVPRVIGRERQCLAGGTNQSPARRTCWTCRSRTTTRPSRLPRRPRRIILNH